MCHVTELSPDLEVKQRWPRLVQSLGITEDQVQTG